MTSYDAFKQAQAPRYTQSPLGDCYVTYGKREARRWARRTLKTELRQLRRRRKKQPPLTRALTVAPVRDSGGGCVAVAEL